MLIRGSGQQQGHQALTRLGTDRVTDHQTTPPNKQAADHPITRSSIDHHRQDTTTQGRRRLDTIMSIIELLLGQVIREKITIPNRPIDHIPSTTSFIDLEMIIRLLRVLNREKDIHLLVMMGLVSLIGEVVDTRDRGVQIITVGGSLREDERGLVALVGDSDNFNLD